SDIVSSIGDLIGKATSWAGDKLGIGDSKESSWYNPISWFNDETQKDGEKIPAFSNALSTALPSGTKSAVDIKR
ncbi:hypothetical protein KDD93_08525, partial [Campylobacter sp. faydin G-24]